MSRERPERIGRRDARGVDVAARQGQRAALQLEPGVETFDRHVDAARASHSTSAGDVSGGVGFGGTRQPSPDFASSCIRGRADLVQIEQRLAVLGTKAST